MHVAMDLVEAAVRTGRDAEAAAHVTALHQAGIAKLSPRLAMLVSGSAALATTRSDAIGFFEQALAVDRADRWPFEQRVNTGLRSGPFVPGGVRQSPVRIFHHGG